MRGDDLQLGEKRRQGTAKTRQGRTFVPPTVAKTKDLGFTGCGKTHREAAL
jgi:hypothetical protein